MAKASTTLAVTYVHAGCVTPSRSRRRGGATTQGFSRQESVTICPPYLAMFCTIASLL